MAKHDFSKLDAERAHLAVAVQGARDLVDQWIAAGTSASTAAGPTGAADADELPIKVLPSASAGLGAGGGPKIPENAALEKLRKKTQQRTQRAQRAQPVRVQPRSAAAAAAAAAATATKTTTSFASDSGSDSDSESRTTIKRPVRRGRVEKYNPKQKGRKKN